MTSRTGESRSETRAFKAEVRQVLDIVIHSLYTHPEIFIRELISNASDALEKMRHESLTQSARADKNAPLEINIVTDTEAHSLTIRDTGIGMTHDEVIANIGTVARSGTREFLEKIQEGNKVDTDLIGKFGVGFYSAFMAADKVHVATRSFKPSAKACVWESDGIGEYTIASAENIPRGTSVTVYLKEDTREFEDTDRIQEIIRRYSNFVPFPIFVNGERINTVQAVWTKMPSELSDEEYTGFYRYISGADDEPFYRLHLTADAPIQLSSILFVPPRNLEKFGFMKLKPGVNLYSRRILIQQHMEKLLPEYLRFITGVVDSEDIKLNISRETLQDDAVFRKLGSFLTKRVFRFLGEEAERDPARYSEFWNLFGMFLKEGVVSDFENRNELAKLLRFRSSASGPGEWASFDDYIGRMKEDQTAVYYISGGSRESIEHGPFFETFHSRGIEVLFLLEPVDDFVMTSLMEFNGKRLISADSADLGLPDGDAPKDDTPAMDADKLVNLTAWMKDTLGDRVKDVRETKRVIDRPAILVNPDEGMTSTMRKIMKASGQDFPMPAGGILEIDPRHPIIASLARLRDGTTDKAFLQSCVEQIFDNALAESGIIEDPRTMIERINRLMERALTSEERKTP